MDSREIIECVRKYPVIYDSSTQRTHARRDAWKDVAAELNTDVAIVQRQWKNIRDSYVKYLKNASLAFRLHANMKFLNPHLQITKPPTESISSKNSNPRNVRNRRKQVEETDSDDEESTSLTRSKRKVTTPNNQSDSGNETKSPTESVSSKSRTPVEKVDSDDEDSTSLRTSQRKVKTLNYSQSYSRNESSDESSSSTSTINKESAHLQLNDSKIINSAIVDEKFVDFANRVKKLSQNNIFTILDQFSQIIDEKLESERSHSNYNMKIKLK